MATSLQPTVPSQIGRSLAPAVAAVLTPVGYLSYVLFVRWFQGHPLKVELLLSAGMFLYFLVLALTGIIATLDWYWGLRGTPLLAVGGLLLWPWGYLSIPIGDVGYASVPFVGVLLVTLIEGAVRFPERVEQLATRSVWRYALAVGLLHFVLGFGLQLYGRHGLPGAFLLVPAIAVTALGLVATGALPVLLWRRHRIVLPAITTASWFLWGFYGTWAARSILPRGDSSGINWISLRPYPDYMFKWTFLMIALLVLAGSELMTWKVSQYLLDTRTKSKG